MTTASSSVRTGARSISPPIATALRAFGAFGSIRKPNGTLRSRFSTFTTANRIYSGISKSSDMPVNVARDKIVTKLDEFHSNIWMMQLGPGK
jgi:hypothetical protein